MKCKCGCGKDISPSPYYPKAMVIGGVKKVYIQREFFKGHRLSPKTKIVECDNCGKEIKKRFSVHLMSLKHRFCSKECTGAFKKRKRINSICKICGAQTSRPKSIVRSSNVFCSTKCHGLYRKTLTGVKNPNYKTNIIKSCINCNKQFATAPWNNYRKFCSVKCYGNYSSKYYIKEKSSNWRGGISSEITKRCSTELWKSLRTKILNRDNWTCKICGVRKKDLSGNALTVHHIIPYRISKNHNEKNLITLCRKCHLKEEWTIHGFQKEIATKKQPVKV